MMKYDLCRSFETRLYNLITSKTMSLRAPSDVPSLSGSSQMRDEARRKASRYGHKDQEAEVSTDDNISID